MSNKVSLAVTMSVAILAASATVSKADIRTTIQSAASGTTVNVSGTYSVSATIHVPSGVTVSGTATFSFTDNTQDGFVVDSGNGNVKLSGFTVKGANHGFHIYGHNVDIESCWAQYNANTGFELQGSGAYNCTINNCQGKYNADSTGGNADGIDVKFGSGTGNKVTNCSAHDNSDDGYDYAGAGAPVATSNCQAYNNGYYNGLTGNGDGFKMGLAGYPGEAHTYTSCVAYNNTKGDTGSGFDSNNNTGGCHLTTCHSYSNKQADRLQNCTLTNCTMQN
jgi:hypothetical protein